MEEREAKEKQKMKKEARQVWIERREKKKHVIRKWNKDEKRQTRKNSKGYEAGKEEKLERYKYEEEEEEPREEDVYEILREEDKERELGAAEERKEEEKAKEEEGGI